MKTHFKKKLKVGQQLVNDHGERATVHELLPDDPDYFARLIDPDGQTFCAIIENPRNWHIKTPKVKKKPLSARIEYSNSDSRGDSTSTLYVDGKRVYTGYGTIDRDLVSTIYRKCGFSLKYEN